MKVYNTRFAPSPTGFAHVGNYRTAYFNYLAARATGGKFFLRIDDTDLNRSDDKYTDVIYDAMNWLGLDFDYAFAQSDYGYRYNVAIDWLLSNDSAYHDDGCVRLRLPDDMPTSWHDLIAGDIKITDDDLKHIDGLVLRKSDGSPTYNFASVMDDIDCDINLIIRGTDHIPNSAKQIAIWIAIWKALDTFFAFSPDNGRKVPDFAHVGLITMNKKKLSKRDSAASLLDYRDAGIKPEAMLNFMLRLGWSPSDANFDKHTKLITKDMAVDMFFKDGAMRSSPASMDVSRLDWYNRRY